MTLKGFWERLHFDWQYHFYFPNFYSMSSWLPDYQVYKETSTELLMALFPALGVRL